MMLNGLILMRQTSGVEGRFLDPPAVFDDGLIAAEEDVGRCEVSEALVVALGVLSVDDGLNLSFQIHGQEVVLMQHPVLEGLMPSLLAPGSPCR
jgi:hypothetical protein